MKRIFYIPIFIFLTYVLGIYVVLPKYREAVSLVESFTAKTKTLKEKRTYFARLKEVSLNLAAHGDAIEKINSALPPDPSLFSLLSFLQVKTSGSGLVLSGISLPALAAENGNIKVFSGNCGLIGSMESLKGFLRLLEKSSRLIDVKSISFATKGQEKVLNFSLSFNIYSY